MVHINERMYSKKRKYNVEESVHLEIYKKTAASEAQNFSSESLSLMLGLIAKRIGKEILVMETIRK